MKFRMGVADERVWRWLYWLTYPAAALLVVYVLAITTGTGNLRFFFNSDTLYMPSIYMDLFVHGTGIRGWHLNGAPNFFPEMVLYMGIMALVKKTALSILVYAILQVLLLMFLIRAFLRRADPDISPFTLLLVQFTLLVLLYSGAAGENLNFPFQILIAGYHCGFFLNVLLAAVAAFRYVRKGKSLPLVLAGLVAVLATLSDRLFLMGFTLPVLALALLETLKKQREWNFLILAGVVLAGSLAGLWLFQWMEKSQVVYFFGTQGKMFAFENMLPSLRNLMAHMEGILTTYAWQRWLVILSLLFVLAAPVYLVFHLRSYLQNRMDPGRLDNFRLLFFLLVFTLVVFFTPVINGYYLGAAHIRYNFAALIMGSAGFFCLLAAFSEGAPRESGTVYRILALSLSVLFLVLIILRGGREEIGPGVRSFVNHYPRQSQVLDSLKTSRGLQYGLADYWNAKYPTMFSHTGVRVYSVYDVDLKPYYHVSNENWYHDGGKGMYAHPVFNFFLMDEGWDREGKLRTVFGEDMDTLYHEQGLMVIKLPDFKIDRSSREMQILKEALRVSGAR